MDDLIYLLIDMCADDCLRRQPNALIIDFVCQFLNSFLIDIWCVRFDDIIEYSTDTKRILECLVHDNRQICINKWKPARDS